MKKKAPKGLPATPKPKPFGYVFGRPTKYDASYCERVVELMYEGYSIEEVAHEMQIGLSTFYVWKEQHPDFREAVTVGEEFSLGKWKAWGRENLNNKNFQYNGYRVQMQNRHHWFEKTKNEHDVVHEVRLKDLK